MQPVLWTKAFFLAALENALVAGLTAFTASSVFVTPSLNSLKTGLTAAGLAALYQFTKSLGSTQTLGSIRSFGRDG